jgi:protein-disulfide isomerase
VATSGEGRSSLIAAIARILCAVVLSIQFFSGGFCDEGDLIAHHRGIESVFPLIMEHRPNRTMQAVEVQAVEADAPLSSRNTAIEDMEPVDEVQHVGVAPHPSGEPSKVSEGGARIRVVAGAANEPMHPVCVGPVAFNRNRGKSFFFYQPAGDQSALAIEIVRTVACLANQYQTPATNPLQQRVVIARLEREWHRGAVDLAEYGFAWHRSLLLVCALSHPVSLCRLLQQRAHFVVRGLLDIAIEHAHCTEGDRSVSADDHGSYDDGRNGAMKRIVLIASLILEVAFAAAQTAPQSVPPQQEGITRQQADAILNELRLIRHLLETDPASDAGAQPVRSGTRAPAATPQKIRMPVSRDWPALGRDDAPVTIVEFIDYQCPFCRRFQAETFAELRKQYIDTGKVRFISRDMPLSFHPHALPAAQAARCATEQGKFWEMHTALLQGTDKLDLDSIIAYAANLQIDVSTLRACIESGRYKAGIEKDTDQAAAIPISGTPGFIIARTASNELDGKVLVGDQPFSVFDA